jgi:proteasome lid subunit RPN8/RPN11
VVPVVNAAHSPVRYRMDPEGQLQGMTDLEADGLSMTAIFHSHPGGPSGLSPTDRVEAAYPESALLVLSPSARGWQGRAFLVDGGRVVEVEVDIGPGGKG